MSRNDTTLEPGDRIAVTHGIRSPAIVEPIARQIAEGILVERPDLERYQFAVESAANLEAKCRLLREWVDEHGFFGNGYRPRSGVLLLLKFEEAARRARKELGLSPLAEVQLEKLKRETVAVGTSLEELRERGRQARTKR
jgi:hypothetical protein